MIDFANPNVVYVQTEALFHEDGSLLPVRFIFDKPYTIDEVISTSVLTEEEYREIFPAPPMVPYTPILQYEIRIGNNRTHIYFFRWPESGPQSLGRWFVVKKRP